MLGRLLRCEVTEKFKSAFNQAVGVAVEYEEGVIRTRRRPRQPFIVAAPLRREGY
jgi:hypothetical protein